MGIEPTPPAWKAGALPLSYARSQTNNSCSEQFTLSLTPTVFMPNRLTEAVGEAGFEPAKAEPPDLQSGPFDRSGIPPVIHSGHQAEVLEATGRFSPSANRCALEFDDRQYLFGASGGTRTHNLRFTKPGLCRLSYASTGAWTISCSI